MRFAALLLFCAASAFGTDCGTGWAHHATLTVHPPAAAIAGVSGFPVRVIGAFTNQLNATGGMVHASGWDHCYSDSGNTINYPFAIFGYDSTDGVNDAAQYPSIPATGSTSTITIWWGKSGVTVNPSSTAVFDANFFQVFPLQETTFNYLDKTSGATNLTTGAAATRATGLTTPNFAQTFAGAQHLIGNSAQTIGGIAFTLSAAFKTSTHTTSQVIVDNREHTGYTGNVMYLDGSDHAECDSSANTGSTGLSVIGSTDLHDGAWHYMTCTAGSNILNLYVDGVLVAGPVTQVSGTRAFPASSQFTIGDVNSLAPWTGQIGEARGSNTARSASWAANEAENFLHPSTYLTFALPGGAADVVLTPGLL